MTQSHADLFNRYQPWRHIVEPGFWIVFFCVQAAMNSWIVWIDVSSSHHPIPFWEPALWEWSSNLVVVALIPAILAFEQKFPLRLLHIRQNFRWHLLASLIFSLSHVGAMVAIRKLGYAIQSETYTFWYGWHVLGYEYLKDLRGYFAILIVVNFYRLVLLRLQGEASLLDAPDDGLPVESIERPERFLVRKLGKEYLLPAAEIEWIQAWGNYVNLRVRGHDYPLRDTMTAIEQRLDPKRFVRVHRSYIVNLDFVETIETLDSGDARAKLRDSNHVPVSRRYRDDLRKASVAC